VAKRHQHEEHENHERWLVSYADFITLLFAFFVVLYSVSKVDNKRMQQVVHSIKFAMHFEGKGGSELPVFEGPPSDGNCLASMGGGDKKQKDEQAKAVEALRRKIEMKLRNYLQERPAGPAAVTLQVEGRKLVIRLSASHFFDPSQAAIRPEMIPVLDAIATEVAALKRPLRVEGHTDDAPLTKTSKFRDNWDLSCSRASAVVSYIEKAHYIDGKLLTAAGLGSTRQMAKNDTVAGREANRRIEMVVEVNASDALDALAKP
jgi:chemotaxis protein MotB